MRFLLDSCGIKPMGILSADAQNSKIWIMLFLVSYGSHAPVTSDDLGIISKSEDFFSDAANQIFVIAAFKIGSTYAFVKDDIPCNQ